MSVFTSKNNKFLENWNIFLIVFIIYYIYNKEKIKNLNPHKSGRKECHMLKKVYGREILKGETYFDVNLLQVSSRNYLLVCPQTNEMISLHGYEFWDAKNILELMSNLPFLSYYKDSVEELSNENLVDGLLSYALDGVDTGDLPAYPLEGSYCFM